MSGLLFKSYFQLSPRVCEPAKYITPQQIALDEITLSQDHTDGVHILE